MMRVRVVADRDDISGLSENLLDALRDEAQVNIRIGQFLVVDQVRVTLGRRAAEPAAPGEPPRKVEGELQESVKPGSVRWANRAQTRIRAEIKSNHPAANALEFGRADLGIAPHPWYRPTIRRIERDLEGVLLHGDDWWKGAR